MYAAISYFTDYEYFGFVEGTSFRDNVWLYNIFAILSYLFFVYYFLWHLKNTFFRKVVWFLLFGFLISSSLYLFFSDVLFVSISQWTTIFGTLLIFLSVIFLYIQLLKSDILLSLKHYLPLYISIGTLVFHLCVTPIDIFSDYFRKENNIFVQLSAGVLLYSNIFMYSTFIAGFIICAQKKKSSY